MPLLQNVAQAGKPLLIIAEEVEEGVVAGGGVALRRCQKALDELMLEGDDR